ncbi:MAG TPA: glycosyltransferase family 4 protein [Candidatus Kapabacteria bacterium]|nr:glycosyltransferase family 4 protein [Candidatus Kapabacteria bacterium]
MKREGSRPLVLHVTNIPTPYRLPYLRAVSDALHRAGFDFHVFFLGRNKRPRNWRIAPEDLHGFRNTLHNGERPIAEAIRLIRLHRPALVVLAWAMDPEALRLLFYCVRHRIPTVLFTGETVGTARGRSYPWLRSLVRRPFFLLATRFLTYGVRSTEYIRSFGVNTARITTGLNVVDTDYFRNSVDALRGEQAGERERARWLRSDGAPFACHLLLVGYMIPGKGISSTIRALEALGRDDIALHLVGSGPREEAHRALVKEAGMEDRVFFHGYHQTDEIPLFYALADVVLFPSFIDVFGLVMSEAAAAALPVIASKHSGGTADVVVDGETGIVVDPADTAAYAAAIALLADDPALRARMGGAARRRAVGVLTLAESASRYLAAVEATLPRAPEAAR